VLRSNRLIGICSAGCYIPLKYVEQTGLSQKEAGSTIDFLQVRPTVNMEEVMKKLSAVGKGRPEL
jgi:hypothetical protein